uniref:Hirudin n=1 Tax=Macrobdella decora TaxID=6405 RepID=A0A482JSZ8_MACDE|nr:hirudin [Macrobdella decora]QBP37043.1 hirudin [Macrobdella decora]
MFSTKVLVFAALCICLTHAMTYKDCTADTTTGCLCGGHLCTGACANDKCNKNDRGTYVKQTVDDVFESFSLDGEN